MDVVMYVWMKLINSNTVWPIDTKFGTRVRHVVEEVVE